MPQTRSYQHSPASWGSPDLEGDGDGREADLEPSLGARECFLGTEHLWGWKGPTTRALDELEIENEHGGDEV